MDLQDRDVRRRWSYRDGAEMEFQGRDKCNMNKETNGKQMEKPHKKTCYKDAVVNT